MTNVDRPQPSRKRARLIPLAFTLAAAVTVAALALPWFALTPDSLAAQDDPQPTWTQFAANETGPSPRWDHTLAADDEGKQLLVFGGRDDNGALGDTWLFDLTTETWTQPDGTGPAPRFGQAIAVDPKARRLYLFGGQSADTFFNDVWRFNFETRRWRQIDTGDSPLPSPRYGTSAVLDGDGHLIVSHGFTFEGRFNDTWSLDIATGTWTDVSPDPDAVRPLNRCLHEAIWDSTENRMILFGGCSSGFGPCPQGDLWSFDPSTRTWTETTGTENPSPRSNPALAADQTGERALLFGGLSDTGYTADFWTLTLGETTIWTPITLDGPAPSARASHDAVFSHGHLYLFGGIGDSGLLNDLWTIEM